MPIGKPPTHVHCDLHNSTSYLVTGYVPVLRSRTRTYQPRALASERRERGMMRVCVQCVRGRTLAKGCQK